MDVVNLCIERILWVKFYWSKCCMGIKLDLYGGQERASLCAYFLEGLEWGLPNPPGWFSSQKNKNYYYYYYYEGTSLSTMPVCYK